MNFLQRLFKTSVPYPSTPYWDAYRQYFTHTSPPRTAIRSLRFVVLDTETTGLDPTQAHLLSIGAVAVRDQKIMIADRFEAFLPQSAATPKNDSIKVHGILPKHAQGTTHTTDYLLSLLDFLRDSILVGHHIAFDYAILNKAFQQQLGGQLMNTTLDTVQLAKRLAAAPLGHTNHAPAHFSLDALCRQYKIPIQGRHTALGDALLTAILFLKLIGRLEQRGIKTYKDLFSR